MMVEACSPNKNGGYVDESVLTATVQADSLIATRSVSNLSDFIYGNDVAAHNIHVKSCRVL